MKRFKMAIAIVALTTFTQTATAQYSNEDDLYYDNKVTYGIGASVGAMNCFTDLGGKKGIGKNSFTDINAGKSQFCGTIFLSAVYKYAIALRLEYTVGKIEAADNVLQSVKATTGGRYDRNLSFRSSITELALILEIHPRYLLKTYDNGDRLPRLSPYLLGGIGYYIFNPQAKINNTWIDLRPLRTEGEGFSEYPDRKQYKLRQLNLPVGAGFKYKLSSLFNFSMECVYRILSTDYLDDVSTKYIDPALFSKYLSGQDLTNALLLNDRQKELNPAHITTAGDVRGNPKKNDSFFSINLKLGFVF